MVKNKDDELVFCLSRDRFDELCSYCGARFDSWFLSGDVDAGRRLLGRLIDLFEFEESKAVRVRRTKKSLLVKDMDAVPPFGFCRRGACECDMRYLQLIPYMVCTYDGLSLGDDLWHILSYWRSESSGEKRLIGGCSVGIGGHLNVDDFVESDRSAGFMGCLKTGATREFFEEIRLPLSEKGFFPFVSGNHRFLGFILDDSDDVGSVHLGFVFEVFLPSENIKLRDPALRSIEFRTLQDQLLTNFDHMESWSQIILRYFRETGQ